MISQKIDGEEHAIAYASRTLSKTELLPENYVTRKELLALERLLSISNITCMDKNSL